MKTPILAALISVSLMSTSFAAPSTSPSGGSAGGTFSSYFQNIAATSCTGNQVLLGFSNTADANYLKGSCVNIGSTLASFFGLYGDAPVGQAIIGFHGTTGAPKFGSVGWGLAGNTGTVAGTNYIGTNDAVNFQIRTNGVNRLTVLSTGQVGVGSTGPGVFEASGSLTSHAYGPALYLQDRNNNGAILFADTNKFFMATTAIDSRVALTYPLTVDLSSGNVGIGTTTPTSYKLEVSGSVGATGFFYSSDKRLKGNITPLKGSLEKILSLNGYSFTWKKDGTPDVGVIAQEVEAVFPDLVKTNSATGYKSVEYGNLVAPLIEAIKEQDKQIKSLKAEVETLKKNLK